MFRFHGVLFKVLGLTVRRKCYFNPKTTKFGLKWVEEGAGTPIILKKNFMKLSHNVALVMGNKSLYEP